jgi:hypothetical protein
MYSGRHIQDDEELEDNFRSTRKPVPLNYEELRGLSDPEARDCLRSLDIFRIRDGACPNSDSSRTSRYRRKLLGMITVGLLSLYVTPAFLSYLNCITNHSLKNLLNLFRGLSPRSVTFT